MVTVGAALSLTGRFAVQGQQAQRGLTLWTEDVNRLGGLVIRPGGSREPVTLTVYDDRSRIAGVAAGIERSIVQDRVDLLFGPYASVLTIAAAEVAERHGRVLWNHGGSSDAVVERGWRLVVNLLSPASRYFVPVLDLATQHPTASGRPVLTVALVYGAAGTFPRAVISGAEAHAATLGLEVVLKAPYPDSALTHQPQVPALTPQPQSPALTPRPPLPLAGEGEQTGGHSARALAALVGEIAARRPDLILGVGTTEADLAFAREIGRQHVESATVALVAAPIELFRDELGSDADGFLGPSQWEPGLLDRPDLGPTSAEFSAAFRARFGQEPDYPAAQAYAAGPIAARCVEMAGSLDDAALRAAAGALDLTTFYGRFRLDPATGQQAGHQVIVVQWQAGRKQIVWPQSAATASRLPSLPPPQQSPPMP